MVDITKGPALTSRKKIIFSLLTAAVAFLLFLLGLELVSRFLFSRYDQGIAVNQLKEIVYDPVAGWRGHRHFSARTPHGVHPVPIQVSINADGFRDEDWDQKLRRASERKAKKLLILGDSFVYGWGSEADDRVTEQLAKVYELNGKPVEVFNTGIPGYGPPNQYRLLPDLLQRIHPEIVVLVFVDNDYGDTALPYEHRFPFRVYKPFYNEKGEIFLNGKIPRRPSLLAWNTPFSGFYFWYSLDALYYLLQDFQYRKYAIPNSRNSPYPIEYFDYIIYEDWFLERYPYIEHTVMALYRKMDELSRRYGARFWVASSRKRLEYVLEGKLKENGISYIPTPPEMEFYWRWEEVLLDGHPNFLWAWLMANQIFAVLEELPFHLNWQRLPQGERIPTVMELRNESRTAPYLSGDWLEREGSGRWLGKDGALLLRNPNPGAGQLLLEFTGRGNGRKRIDVVYEQNRTICRFDLMLKMTTQTCEIENEHRGNFLFLQLLPAGDNLMNGKNSKTAPKKRSAFFERIAVYEKTE